MTTALPSNFNGLNVSSLRQILGRTEVLASSAHGGWFGKRTDLFQDDSGFSELFLTGENKHK